MEWAPRQAASAKKRYISTRPSYWFDFPEISQPHFKLNHTHGRTFFCMLRRNWDYLIFKLNLLTFSLELLNNWSEMYCHTEINMKLKKNHADKKTERSSVV